MMRVKRLNMDSSWFLEWGKNRFILDPWLIGSEVDGFKWLNEQWHVIPPVEIENLPDHDFILISQSYSDHCHLPSLDQMDKTKPLIASQKAFKLLSKKYPNRDIRLIPELGEDPLKWNGLEISSIHPGNKLDPVYFSLIIRLNGEAIFYAAHGFQLKQKHLELLKETEIKLLFTTFTDFKLPAIMGGRVNPGLENVDHLVKSLSPNYIINSHDEPKRARGLVSKLAKIKYSDLSKVKLPGQSKFVQTPDYSSVELD